MKRTILAVFVAALFLSASFVKAQNTPAMYFCQKYDSQKGEVNISDRFTKGNITVMVKSDVKLGLEKVHIQIDRWDSNNSCFRFYKKFDYKIKPDMKYVYFSKNNDSDMTLNEAGFYRVFLLDDSDDTVTSGIIQVI